MPPAKESKALVRRPKIETLIKVVRNEQVVLDEDLAPLYGVETGALTRAVRRNAARFPEDFMFQLSDEEFEALRSQSGISKEGRGGRRYAPYAFTEQGVAMLSSVLRSEQAVAINIEIMRAFVEMRRAASSHAELARRFERLEREMSKRLDAHDEQIAVALNGIKALMRPKPVKKKGKLGFAPPDDD